MYIGPERAARAYAKGTRIDRRRPAGARRCATSATTTRRTRRSAASARWSRWTRAASCPTSCSSATPWPPGRTPRTTSRRCSRRSCTASRRRWATTTGAASPTSSPCSWARACPPCAASRRGTWPVSFSLSRSRRADRRRYIVACSGRDLRTPLKYISNVSAAFWRSPFDDYFVRLCLH